MQGNLIGIIADTHDNRAAIERAVAVFNRREVSLVAHAGDFVAPFTVLDFKKLVCPMEMVFGNNDGERVGLSAAFKDCGTLLPGPRVFLHYGKKILLMHEHGCLEQVAAAAAADVIIYGHTHDVDIRPGPPFIINPGEAGGWLRGRSTAALLDLDRMEAELVTL